jgi:hypothetical protein
LRTRVTTRASTPSRTPRSQLPLPVTRYASTFPRKNQRLSSFQVPHSMTKSSFFVQRFSKLNQRAYVCQDRLGTMTTGGVLCNGCEEVEKGRLLRCCAGTKLVPMGPYGKAVAWDPDPSKRTHVRANTPSPFPVHCVFQLSADLCRACLGKTLPSQAIIRQKPADSTRRFVFLHVQVGDKVTGNCVTLPGGGSYKVTLQLQASPPSTRSF